LSQENVKAVVAMYDAFARGDIDGVLADLAPDVHWSVAENFIYSDGNPYRGIEAVRNGVFGRVPGDWDSYDLEFEEILDAGEAVVSRGRYLAKHKRTGAKVSAQFAHVFKFRDGKIALFQQYTDTAQFRDAMGT